MQGGRCAGGIHSGQQGPGRRGAEGQVRLSCSFRSGGGGARRVLEGASPRVSARAPGTPSSLPRLPGEAACPWTAPRTPQPAPAGAAISSLETQEKMSSPAFEHGPVSAPASLSIRPGTTRWVSHGEAV